ncbi:hypothetical protein GCM10027217_41790 [Pseudomaricurvus hydrocarbonicus]
MQLESSFKSQVTFRPKMRFPGCTEIIFPEQLNEFVNLVCSQTSSIKGDYEVMPTEDRERLWGQVRQLKTSLAVLEAQAYCG